MKKLLLCLAFAAFSISDFAQVDLSSVAKIGYQTGTKRVGIGVDARYGFQNNLRIAPEIIFYFPKDHITGLDINVDFHYLIPLSPAAKFYPLIGGAIDNNYYSREGEKSYADTHFGFNIGGGVDYDLSEKNYLNAQFRYTLNKYNYGFFTLGYGFRF